MQFIGDYHLHTQVSDGRADISDHVAAAKQRGLKQIAICDHSFASLFYHATEKKLKAQWAEISSLSDCGLKIYRGIEANLIGFKLDVPNEIVRGLDVLTVGFHRFISPAKMRGESKFLLVNGFGLKASKKKLIEKNTEAYIRVMRTYPVDVIAHLGHRAPVDFDRVCECAAENAVYIELNAKHLDALEAGIDAAIASGVKFIVGSDAHSAKKTGDFKAVEEFISRHQIPADRVYGTEGNPPVFKHKKEWSYGSIV